MINTSTRPREKQPPAFTSWADGRAWQSLRSVHITSWLLLLAAFVGFNIFAVQTIAAPQQRDYPANWHGAQWIAAPDASRPVAYFRMSFALEAQPRDAFLTMQAVQFYRVYINNTLVDDTSNNYRNGSIRDTNIYDVAAFLQSGDNVVAVRVVNGDVGAPALRAVLGITISGQLQVFPTNTAWRTTTDSSLTGQPAQSGQTSWPSAAFEDSAWQDATLSTATPPDNVISFDPLTFETPLPQTWISAGPNPDAYFFHSIPYSGSGEVWLRVASTGTSVVYINGQEVLNQPPRIPLDQTLTAPPSQVDFIAGIYDVTPYLHAGSNTIAAHVASATGVWIASSPSIQPAALALDLLIIGSQGLSNRIVADTTWRTSPVSAPGWPSGNGTATWGDGQEFSATSVTQVPVYRIPAPQYEEVAFGSAVSIALVVTLLLQLFIVLGIILQRVLSVGTLSLTSAMDRMALALAPSLGLMALLFTLSLEPAIPHPFPCTPLWLGLTAALTLVMFALILAGPRLEPATRPAARAIARLSARLSASLPRRWSPTSVAIGLVVTLLIGLGAFLVFYKLDYESYWQDELVSLLAAKGVLTYGLPQWVTGVIYTKSELYSYIVAPVMAIFGTSPWALRGISAVEHIIVLVLLYFLGRYFVNRRVGLVALVLAVASPFALDWGRQMRMYQQAQLFALIVMYLFYRAMQPNTKRRYIYLSMAATVAMYLSHEETWIFLPVLVIYFLATQRLTWIRNKHWWIAGLSAIGIVLAQLAWWKLTRHPRLGTDRTVRPMIGYYPTNFYFYLRLLFAQFSTKTLLPQTYYLCIVSVLAAVSVVRSLFIRDGRLRYLALWLVVPLFFLSFFFGMTSARYFYAALTVMLLLAAVALVWMIDLVRKIAYRRLPPVAGRAIVASFALLVVLAVCVSEIVPIGGFSPAINLVGLSYTHQNPDYERAGQYVQAHWQPGDILISMYPAVDANFYAKHPDFAVYQGKVLYILVQDGHIVESYVGTPMLLNEQDFNQVLAQYHRIWLVQANGYQGGIGNSGFSPIAQNFTLVYEGQQTYVYLRTG